MNAPNAPYRPVLTDAARPATFAVRAVDENGAPRETPIAGEHPLTLYVDKRELLTIMTLGAAPEALAIGYLRNQRLLERIEDIVSVQVDWEVNAVAVTTRHGLEDLDAKTEQAHHDHRLRAGNGVRRPDGGDRTVRLPAGATLSRATLYALLERVRAARDDLQAGGRRARLRAGDQRPRRRSEILNFVEDVGRHNAVDAIAGMMWLDRVDGGDKIFYTTGRLTSEMVIKAAQMGIPFLVSRSGLTQMGYEIAQPGRHDDDRPRDQQAFPAVHRRRALPRRCVTSRAPWRTESAAPNDAGRRHPARHTANAMCGRVRFVARFPSRFCCHCHCESCRRAHCAGFVTWIGFKSEQVTIVAGADELVALRVIARHARTFCRVCGTKLFFESSRWPGETHIALAAFDDRRRSRAAGPRVLRGARAHGYRWPHDPAPTTQQRGISGLVLAGGQGRRMGSVDKGLVALARPADGRACARALAAAGRRSPDQRQPAISPSTRRSATR